MSMALLYYLISVAGALDSTLSFMLFVCGVGTFVTVIARLFVSDEEFDNGGRAVWNKALKIFSSLFIVCMLLNVLTPTKKDMMIIAGLNIGEKGVQKVMDEAGEFYPLLKDIIKSKLTEMYNEQQTKTKKSNEKSSN